MKNHPYGPVFYYFEGKKDGLGTIFAKIKGVSMANKRIWLGMLAMALIFGMTVIGCEQEEPEKTGGSLTVTNTTADVYA